MCAASPDAAEYYKQANTLTSMLYPGGAGTDASRKTGDATIPPYGYRTEAIQSGLDQVGQVIAQRQLRSQVLQPAYAALGNDGGGAAYQKLEQGFNANISPAAASVIQQINAMPKGQAKQQAAAAFFKTNPSAGEWAADNRVLR